mmetsp:Transcript_7350/g.29418  ORF Transcript_7350/g.29418 Transcript_7350/m.29418 type:complete len:297 (+) Transcript_7350:590-1480(+)
MPPTAPATHSLHWRTLRLQLLGGSCIGRLRTLAMRWRVGTVAGVRQAPCPGTWLSWGGLLPLAAPRASQAMQLHSGSNGRKWQQRASHQVPYLASGKHLARGGGACCPGRGTRSGPGPAGNSHLRDKHLPASKTFSSLRLRLFGKSGSPSETAKARPGRRSVCTIFLTRSTLRSSPATLTRRPSQSGVSTAQAAFGTMRDWGAPTPWSRQRCWIGQPDWPGCQRTESECPGGAAGDLLCCARSLLRYLPWLRRQQGMILSHKQLVRAKPSKFSAPDTASLGQGQVFELTMDGLTGS